MLGLREQVSWRAGKVQADHAAVLPGAAAQEAQRVAGVLQQVARRVADGLSGRGEISPASPLRAPSRFYQAAIV